MRQAQVLVEEQFQLLEITPPIGATKRRRMNCVVEV